jgi:hypothetical protein
MCDGVAKRYKQTCQPSWYFGRSWLVVLETRTWAYQKIRKNTHTAAMTARPAIFTLGAVTSEISARSGSRFTSGHGRASLGAHITPLTMRKVKFVLKESDTLWVWLEHIKAKSPNEPLNPTKNHLNVQKKLRLDFGAWIQDGLRHSFGTYYHNLIRSIPEVVYVMGNSVGIAKRHYVREVSKEWNDKFWSLKPTA